MRVDGRLDHRPDIGERPALPAGPGRAGPGRVHRSGRRLPMGVGERLDTRDAIQGVSWPLDSLPDTFEAPSSSRHEEAPAPIWSVQGPLLGSPGWIRTNNPSIITEVEQAL